VHIFLTSFRRRSSIENCLDMNLKNLVQLNWKAGLTVALVSLPMSVSIGVASGSTPTAGIITAVWAGLIAAFFADSHFNIVGPAGALTGILAAFAFIHGPELLPMLAIITGAIIFLCYLLKINRYLVFIPTSVIHGFSLGVAMLLAFSQLNFAFGLEGLVKHEAFIDNLITSISAIPQLSVPTTVVFIAFLAGLFILLKKLPKVPAVIVLTPVGILLGYASTQGWLPFSILTLADKFPSISPALISIPNFTLNYTIVSTAITVAVVAMLETLLCGKVANTITKTRFDERKELFGLSLANIGSGLFGGLPATAVLARTSLNVKSGATHRTSQGINAVIIALVSMLFLGTFKYLPLPVVAAILWFTALRMIEIHHLTRYIKYEIQSFWISYIVAITMIFEDPLIAIAIGSAISLLLLVERVSRGAYSIRASTKGPDNTHSTFYSLQECDSTTCDVITYTIKGPLVYISAQSHTLNLKRLHVENKAVIVRMGETTVIDSDGIDAFDEIIETLKSMNCSIFICSIPEQSLPIMAMSEQFDILNTKGHVFYNSDEALEYALKES
jgi:MFS superfamily sulfate permease-like transporter